jgi:hypothetical protein
MNVKNEEDTILGSETRQSQASDGGALHPHSSSESQTDSLSGWAVAGAALAIGVACVSIYQNAPVLYKAGRDWWNRLF